MSLPFEKFDWNQVTCDDYQNRIILSAQYQERAESEDWLYGWLGQELAEISEKLAPFDTFDDIKADEAAMKGILYECGDSLWMISETVRMFEFPLGKWLAYEMELRGRQHTYERLITKRYTDQPGEVSPDPLLDDVQAAFLPESRIRYAHAPSPESWADQISYGLRVRFNGEHKFRDGLWFGFCNVVDLANVLDVKLSTIAEMNYEKVMDRMRRQVTFKGAGDYR